MKIAVISKNTIKEIIRDKIYYIFLVFALIMIGGSMLLADLSMGAQIKVVKDMGLGIISIFSLLSAIFLGINLLNKEIEKKTVYNIFSKPISRCQFILGKYAGLVFSLVLLIAVMAAGLLMLGFLYEKVFDLSIFLAAFMIFIEVMIITAFVLFFSTFSSPVLSGIFTLCIYILGHLAGELKVLSSTMAGSLASFVLKCLYYLLPNLSNFDIKSEIVQKILPSKGYMAACLSYGALYVAILLFLSVAIYNRKDMK
ncbi:MAG: ABC transporter permease [Candidatus Omnitrophica bacterium]|nr:ABC transporter permease [Candidatus Omnitrophota bacterium]